MRTPVMSSPSSRLLRGDILQEGVGAEGGCYKKSRGGTATGIGRSSS